MGTNNGLQYFQDGDFRNVVPPASMDINIKYVYRIIEGPNGEIITNHNRGLCIITPTVVGGRVVSLKFDNIPFSEVAGLSNLDLTCFAVDHHGDIWIAMRKDLYSYNPREGAFTQHYHPEILTNTIDMLYVDSKNNIILSTNKGIYNITSGVKYENVNIPEQINAFVEDNYSNLWLAGNNMIVKLKGDDSGNMFLYRTSMVDRFSTAYCSRNGQLYVCGNNGFITFNPADITQDTNDKHTVISSLEMHGEEVLPGRKYNNQQILKESITNCQKIILSHSNNSIKINFSLLDFSAPLSNKYSYILDGYDRQWTTVSGLNNYASYSQLPAGKYRFKLRGANSDDVWEEGQAELEIVVRSPWWSCTVAIIIYLLIALGIVALVISNIYTRSKLARNLYLSTIEQQ
ncbi:MAG: triple tyrosine motif-containing protein [Rikenellaceae bacterium]